MPFRTGNSDIWQYDIVIAGCRFRGSTRTTDFETAKAIEAQIRADARAGVARGTRYTLSEALGTYYRDKARHQPSARTTASQTRTILQLLNGDRPIMKLTNADVLEFVARHRATASNATVNRKLQLLGRAIRHMARFYAAEVPQLDLKAAETKEPKERIRELSMNEQASLFRHLRADLHPFVQFALMTGARRATICNLLWGDIDLPNSEMTFRMKGGDSMIFPVNAELRAMLSSLPRSNVISHRRYVFTYLNQETSDRLRIRPGGGGIHAKFKAAVVAADIHDFRFHDLRHTFATRMLRRTQNIKLVSRLLGHASIETTDRYAHVLVSDMRSALDSFSALSNGDPQNIPQSIRLSD